jgi:hypothetical protein
VPKSYRPTEFRLRSATFSQIVWDQVIVIDGVVYRWALTFLDVIVDGAPK